MSILVLFGGESVEHEISVITANQVMMALNINYNVIPVYISKENKFYYTKDLMDIKSYKNIDKITKKSNEVRICKCNKRYYLKRRGIKGKIYFDYAFPIVHGKGMEDGTLLAYLKFKKIPVISDNLSFYVIAQNKVLTKRVLNEINIKNSKFIEVKKGDSIKNVKFPVIVKPTNLGSSIGVKKANNEDELNLAVKEAFKYDKSIIIEEFLENSKEYNISVVEKGGEIITSNIEEVIKDNDILDYSQKYEVGKKKAGMASSKRIVPANIDKAIKCKIEKYAVDIYKHFGAKGVIRIDFLYNGEIYVNEINSIPGSYSYYLWEGKMDFVELLDSVIESSKKDFFQDKKIIKCIDKMTIFENFDGDSSKIKQK